jgi:hypothetical protein
MYGNIAIYDEMKKKSNENDKPGPSHMIIWFLLVASASPQISHGYLVRIKLLKKVPVLLPLLPLRFHSVHQMIL